MEAGYIPDRLRPYARMMGREVAPPRRRLLWWHRLPGKRSHWATGGPIGRPRYQEPSTFVIETVKGELLRYTPGYPLAALQAVVGKGRTRTADTQTRRTLEQAVYIVVRGHKRRAKVVASVLDCGVRTIERMVRAAENEK